MLQKLTFLGRDPLRALLVVNSVVLVTLILFGAFSTSRIGAMTWGPTTDLWASTIAISDIQLGMDGGVGRRELSFAMAKILTDTGSDINVGTSNEMVANPALVTKAFQTAAAITAASLPHVSMDSGMLTTTVFEDIGYSDFYNIAFRLFGFNAKSTYYLYLALLSCGFVLFLVGHWRSTIGLGVLGLGLSGIFLLATSGTFDSPLLPSIAANRALGSLAMLPLLHVIVSTIELRPLSTAAKVATALQICLLVLTINLRTTVIWGLIGLGLLLAILVAVRLFVVWREPRHTNFVSAFFESASIRRAILIVGVTLVGFVAYSGVRGSQLSFLYGGDDILPHHLRWHSAFLALSAHPDWRSRPEFAGIKQNGLSDAVSWVTYERFMAQEFPNTPALTRVNGNLHKMGLHERIMKLKFMEFIHNNKQYVLELYLFYKPLVYLKTLLYSVANLKILPWLIGLPSMALFAWAIANSKGSRVPQTVAFSITIAWLCSLLPFEWGYTHIHVFTDQIIMLTVFFYTIIAALVVWLARELRGRDVGGAQAHSS